MNSARHSFEGAAHVPGGCQLFRRERPADIVLKCSKPSGRSGLDCGDDRANEGVEHEVIRREALGTLSTLSHRRARRLRRSNAAYGEKDYYLGNHPLWEINKSQSVFARCSDH